MDKEQIIINGVNVSGCLFYQSNFEEDYDVRIKHFCSNWHNSCESSNNSNCYFKQLARKTQECDNWKHQAELGSETTDRLSKQLEEKIQEYEELKEELERTEEDLKHQCVDCMNAKSDRYFKALEEIEKVLSHCIMTGAIVKILTIINKAKGEE